MNRINMVCKIYAILSIFLFLVLISSAHALVEIEPASENLSIFSDPEFVFNVTISGVDNVYGFQFDIIYNDTIFGVTDVSEGTFLSRNGQDETFCLGPDLSTPGLIDNFACSRTESGSVSGSGVLASIIFNLKSLATFPATSDIKLSNVKISDINSQPLDNSSQDGQATVYECLYGETKGCIENDYPGTQTCNPDNQWGTCNIYTDGGGGSSDGGYFVPSDGTNGEEGEDGGEGPSYSGDINDDGCVNTQDLVLIGSNFGLTSGFDSRADVNDDGEVDIVDLVLVAIDFGGGPNC